MNSIQLFWEHSPLWLLPVLLLSVVLAWWHYAGNQDFSKGLTWFLGGIRTLIYTLAGLLLLNPLLRFIKENQLPPVSVILVDNSRSVSLSTRQDSMQVFLKNLSGLRKKLEASGSRVFVEGLDGPFSDSSGILFQENITNLEKSFKRLRSAYEGQNLAQIILASDGIINQGSDLQETLISCKVHTIGLGNPNPGKDLRIREIRHNRLVYLGNQFPVNVEVQASGIPARQVNVRLLENGKIADSKTISLSPSGLGKAEFSLKAQQKGIHEYEVELDSFTGEVTVENNRRKFFIETVSEKQKVLLLASSPHPDLKAIKSALEPLEQIELTTLIAGLDAFRPDQYKLVILHQLPDRTGSFSNQVSQLLQKPNTGIWLITTPFTDFSKLKASCSWLNVMGRNGPAEEAGNQFDQNFQRFQFEEPYRETLRSLPPVKSPSASYTWKGPSEAILNQMIGRVASPTPLFSFQNANDNSKAIFWGDGLWLWRLNEFGRNDNTEAVDQLIQKTCLLLMSASRKKQLHVSSLADEYAESDVPSFRIETFNSLMEPVFDKKIRMRISRNGGNDMEFSMITASGNPPLRTQSMPAGAYHYTATTNIDGKELKEEGDFIVRALDLEARQLEANHALLRGISSKTKAGFYSIASMMSLADKESLPPTLVEFTDWNENFLGIKWLLALFLLLLSAEWLLRKINGSL